MLGWLLTSVLTLTEAHAAFRSNGALKTNVVDGAITATLVKGFHFNAKAPNSVEMDGQRLRPTSIQPTRVEFSSLPKEWSIARATFYICDDEVTFCEAVSHEIKNSGGGALSVNEGDKKVELPVASAPSVPLTTNAHGFIENDFNQALAIARKNKKLLLIDFSARWCPACVRMEQEIFPSAQFQKMSKDYVKLKIDVDRLENSVFSEKFKVIGIPTILVLNSEQQEINRVVDYQSLEGLAEFLSSVKTDPTSLSRLMVQAKGKNPKVLLRLGKRLAAAGRFKDSLTYLSQINPPPVELLGVKVQAAEGEKNYAEVLRQAIDAEPETVRSLVWRSELLGVTKDQEEKTDIKKDGLSIADDFLKDKEAIIEGAKGFNFGEYQGHESFLIATLRAELIRASGASPKEVTEGWKKAARVGRELKIPASQIGLSMRRLMVLGEAGLWDEADKLSEAMVKSDPQNPELQRRRMRILFERKDFKGAIDLGQQVLQKSYGKNEYMVAEALAKSYIEAKQYGEGINLIERFLNRPEADWDSLKSYRKKFEDLKQKIPKDLPH